MKSLNAHKVAYVVIGAAAFPVHGYSRSTMDIDIFIKPTRRNAQFTIKALKSFGYDTSDLSLEDLLAKKVLIRQYLIETDIHPFVKGITFEQVWANKVKNRVGHISAYFASLDDLIQMKKAAGRPQDKADLKVLNRLKNSPGDRG